jgi:hypothetical protein
VIRAGQRVVVIGPSGCGKTRFEMPLLEGVQSVVVFDVKQDPDEWLSWGPAHGYEVISEPMLIARLPRVVLRVDDLWLQDRQGWTDPSRPGYRWTEACQLVFARGNTTVVFTEGLQLLPSAGANPWARKVVTQGRSRRVTTITDIQVANWTDTLLIRQADHAFVFRCDAADVKLLRSRGADPRPLLSLEDHAWAHHVQGARDWTLYEPLPASRIWGGPAEPVRRPARRRAPARRGSRGATPAPGPEGALPPA